MAITTYKAKARKFIKYDGQFINADEEFEVKIEDAEEMKKHADINIPKEDKKAAAKGKKEEDKGEGEKEGE